MWDFNTNQPRGLLEPNFNQPTWLTADESNNRIVVNYGEPEWNWDQLGRISIVDFNEGTVRDMPGFRRYVEDATVSGQCLKK